VELWKNQNPYPVAKNATKAGHPLVLSLMVGSTDQSPRPGRAKFTPTASAPLVWSGRPRPLPLTLILMLIPHAQSERYPSKRLSGTATAPAYPMDFECNGDVSPSVGSYWLMMMR
jgi:hypothetical protein